MKKFSLMSIFLVVSLVVFLPDTLIAKEDLTAEDLAWKSYRASYYGGDDVKARIHMKITDNQDRVRERSLTLLRKDVGESKQKYYAYFHEPSDLRRMVFLVWTHAGDDDDRWLYLPSIDLVQRITGSQKRNSFAGSNFTYEDMTGRYPGNDNFKLLGETTYKGDTVYELKGTPKNSEMVEFSYYRVLIDKETYLPLKGVFYTPQGDPQRTLTLEETETIEGIVTPTVQKAVNHQTGSHTMVKMSEIDYNVGLPERVFEKRYLRRPPTPWVTP